MGDSTCVVGACEPSPPATLPRTGVRWPACADCHALRTVLHGFHTVLRGVSRMVCVSVFGFS